MKIEFVGVGEAFDPALGNTSVLLHSETKLLVDCGYAIPLRLFDREWDANYLDALYVTHFHADHTFGIPALITRLQEDGRTSPFVIIGQPGVREHVHELIRLAYPGIRTRLRYDLHFIETKDPVRFRDLDLAFAETSHSVRNFAVRVTTDRVSVCISGDGDMTPASRELFSNCQFLVHEAYTFSTDAPNHAMGTSVFDFASTIPSLQGLALVHIQRGERRKSARQFAGLKPRAAFRVLVPEPGELIEV